MRSQQNSVADGNQYANNGERLNVGNNNNSNYYNEDIFDEPEYYTQGNTPTLNSSFNFLKSLLGAGIFTFPAVYLKSGFFFSLVSLILCTVYIYWTSNMITVLGDEYKTLKYGNIAKRSLGRLGSAIYSISTILLTFTGMVAYGVIVSSSIPPVVLALTGNTDSDVFEQVTIPDNPAWKLLDRRMILLLATVIVLLPLCLVKELKFLSFTSVFGLFYILFICVVSVVKTSISDSRYPPNTLSKSELFSIVKADGLSAAISSAAFANIVQHSQLPFFAKMSDRSMKAKKSVIGSCLIASTLLILLFSIPTYLNAGDGVKGDILTYFPDDDVLINVTRLAFALNIMLTFPLLNYVCRDTVANITHGGLDNLSTTMYVVYTVTIVAAAALLGSIFCDLGVVVNLSGGLSASVIALILPQLCYARWKHLNGVPLKRLIPLLSSTALGILTVIFTIIDTSKDIASGSQKVCKHKYI